jgi:hypothetical protein
MIFFGIKHTERLVSLLTGCYFFSGSVHGVAAALAILLPQNRLHFPPRRGA